MKQTEHPNKDCVFCRILRGELESLVVAETDDTIAFLDSRPLFLGHTLVIPRTHVETLMDADSDLGASVFLEARRVSIGVQKAMKAAGIFIAANNGVSQSVPHLHVHVVPRNKKDGLRGFMWPRLKYESEQHAASAAEQIRRELENP